MTIVKNYIPYEVWFSVLNRIEYDRLLTIDREMLTSLIDDRSNLPLLIDHENYDARNKNF